MRVHGHFSVLILEKFHKCSASLIIDSDSCVDYCEDDALLGVMVKIEDLLAHFVLGPHQLVLCLPVFEMSEVDESL